MSRALSVALAGGLLTSACGAEDIELTHTDVGVLREAAADALLETNESGAGDVVLIQGDSELPACDSASPPPACRGLGQPCGSASDCCSTHCASGQCVLPGACSGAGSPCSSRADCCSGLCEPVNGTPARACLAECRPTGAACQWARDCCSFACNSGSCGGTECFREGTDCTTDAQCCSNKCDASSGNKCVLDPVAPCRPTGEDCNSGGGGPCCGVCDDTSQRCDPGPGPCRATGALCATASDCCHGTCTDDGTGRHLCMSPPLANGSTCQSGFECTGGSCVGNPPVCGSQTPVCRITGAACATGADCCSGVCASGTCQGCNEGTR